MPVPVIIDGRSLQAEPGMTVLEAARAHGIFIPTLCHHPKLPPFGGCRLCVVEIEGMRGFPTACAVPIREGMVIRTATEAVQDLRRETLSLILSEHPYTCLVCEQRARCDAFQGTIRKAAVTTGCQYCPKNGQCEIQTLVTYLDLRDVPYPIAYRGLSPEQDDPFFDRDYNLCILCGRCVRVCQEIRHAGVLAFLNRGSQAIVGTAFGRSHLEAGCEFCGACVDVCPTGTLADKRGKWEGIPTAIVPSVCPYCSVGCAVNVQVKEGRVIRTVGRDEGPANDGQLCVRGRFGVVDVVHHPGRLKVPLVRRDGRLVGASWEEALEAAAGGLAGRSGDAVAVVASAAASNEEVYLLQKLARAVFQSNNIALAAGFPEDPGAEGVAGTLRTIDGPAIRDVRGAGCIVAVGTNAWESHPILGLEARHALSRGARLITLDTRRTKLAQQSHVWLQPSVATDYFVLAGIVAALLAPDPQAAGTAEAAAAADGRLAALGLAGLDLETVEARTGVGPAAIRAAARLMAEHAPVVILYGSGVTHHPTAMEVIRAIRTLSLVLGGAGIIGVPGEGNMVGAHDMGAHPAFLPGYRAVADPEARAAFEAAWGIPLDPAPGRTWPAILGGVREGRIAALYLAGEIPPVPELSQVEFLVVQDILPTEAMRHAQVVLPATTFAEMDGTLTNLEGRVQLLRQAIPPLGRSRPGWMVVRDVARQILASRGARAAGWDYASAADVMTEVASLVPAYAAVDLETLGVGGAVRRFEPVLALPPSFGLDGIPHLASEEFPFTLITERNLFCYRGACLTEQVRGMSRVKEEEVLQLNPADAGRLGIADGAVVRVATPHGSAESVVRVTNGMPGGVVFTSINRVTGSPLFPDLIPTAKACAVRIEAIRGEA